MYGTHLYGEQVSATLNATNSTDSSARAIKAQIKWALLALLSNPPLNAEENYAQAA